jgi:hypothetical protein
MIHNVTGQHTQGKDTPSYSTCLCAKLPQRLTCRLLHNCLGHVATSCAEAPHQQQQAIIQQAPLRT